MARRPLATSRLSGNRSRRPQFERLERRTLLATTPIEVLAAGLSGQEQMTLEIDGVAVQTWNNIGGDFSNGVYQSFNYTHPTSVSANRIRVRFSDGAGSANDLRVDGIRVGGVFYESESSKTFSTGTWDSVAGDFTPRFAQSEFLHREGGYFDYGQADAAVLEIFAAGATGAETLALEIGGVRVTEFQNVGGDFNNRVFETLQYSHNGALAPGQVRLVLVDGTTGPAGDRNLRIDAIAINGVRYETEDPSVYSVGSYRASDGCAPGFKQSEDLACTGYFDFATPPGSVLQIFAAGATGTETLALEIDGERVAEFTNVGGDFGGRVFQTLSYAHDTLVDASQVRVVLVDGTTGPAGDRNARIDAITIDGQRFETEDASVFSVGSYRASDGCAPGFKSSEDLACTGYFEFGQDPNAGSIIEVRAAGATGEEQMELQIDGVTVATWTSVGGGYGSGDFLAFRYVHTETVSASRVRVAFTNDGLTSLGADRNLRVDGISLDGVFLQSEASTVLSTGTFTLADGCAPGFKQSEFLHCGGYLQFDAPTGDPGVIGIGSTQFPVGEAEGTVTVTFVRTDGDSGPATVDYTTVPGTATPGQDYVSRSGTVVFADGQTQASVDITILNDSASEGTEAFNLAIDRVTGATAGQPRTTTISIFDDEQPSAGDGNGLQGEYFTGQNFDNSLFTRTDLTVNFNWGGGSPGGGLGNDNFSIRWTGEVQPQYSETYTFETRTDDGVRLWIDDQLIIDQWVDQPATSVTGQISLLAGRKYDLRMEYYENSGQSSARLRWSSPSQSLAVVPASQLFSNPVTPTDGSFSGETIVSGLSRPTAIEFAPTGQMFIAQKDGIVRVYENGALVPGSFIDLRDEVNDIQDRGLLGLEIDPNFPAEPYVYLLYTYDPPETLTRTGLAGPDGAGNRVSRLIRVTADAANGYRTVVPGSEVILLGENSVWENISAPDQDGTNNVNLPESCDGIEDCIPVDSRSHSIGALAFGTDGSLYITNGDGTSFGRVDPRTVRVQDLDNLAGKVLRIDPDTGFGLPDNPFYEAGDPDSNQSKVVNYGLRNPFRLAIHPETNTPFVSDVGWNSWEEINGGFGENYGWPFYEGGNGQNLQTGGYNTLPEAPAFYADNNAVAPDYSRSHSAGGVAMIIGDFYTGSLYPAQYQDTVFFTDFGDPTIRALPVAADGSVGTPIVVMGSVGSVVEMTMGPDGTMYYVDLNGGNVGRFRFDATASAASLAAALSLETEQQMAAASAFASLSVASQVSIPQEPAPAPIDSPIATPLGGNDLLLLASELVGSNHTVGAQIATPAEEDVDEETLDDAFAIALSDLSGDTP